MATYDRTLGTTSIPSSSDSRISRDLRLDWSALFGGSLVGWGILYLLSMIGMVAGLSVIDAFGVRPATSNAGAAIWGAASAIISSFVGAFIVVRLAGDRRRSESIGHGAVAWTDESPRRQAALPSRCHGRHLQAWTATARNH